MPAPSDALPRQVLAAIRGQDPDALKLLLHPYLHWSDRNGRPIRGRKNVLTYLSATPVDRLPSEYEVRDGQIYRWVEPENQ